MKNLEIGLLLLVCATSLQAQEFLEFRGAYQKYWYADYMVTRGNWVTDAFFVGVPGENEADLGFGRTLSLGETLTIIPMIYANTTIESGHLRIKPGIIALLNSGYWSGNMFLAYNFAPSKSEKNYLILDTFEVTRKITDGWRLGASAGIFLQVEDWNPLVGPVIKREDSLGAWSVSFRFGPGQSEIRASRTLNIP